MLSKKVYKANENIFLAENKKGGLIFLCQIIYIFEKIKGVDKHISCIEKNSVMK